MSALDLDGVFDAKELINAGGEPTMMSVAVTRAARLMTIEG